ncbi:MAG: alpha/beta hydrolase [Xanthobacteraceae bacterium]
MRKTEIGGFPALTVDGRHGRPLVLFIHGSFSTHEPFSRWLTVCEKSGWRAAVAARRGRLDLDPPCADGLTIADYLDDTRRVIDALGERPILIGHSLGGLIAQKLAEEDRAAALVLLAPVPPWPLMPQADALPALAPMLPSILAGRPVLPSYWSAVRLILNRVPQPDRRRIHASLVHESGIAYREMTFGTVRTSPEKVPCPVRVIAAEQDASSRPPSPAQFATTMVPSSSCTRRTGTGWSRSPGLKRSHRTSSAGSTVLRCGRLPEGCNNA